MNLTYPDSTASASALESELVESTAEVVRIRLPGGEIPADSVSWTSVMTLVLWVGCLAIGVLGFVVPYSRPAREVEGLPAIEAEILNVELTPDPVISPAVSMAPPPPLPPVVQEAGLPELVDRQSLAEPERAIEFPVPVEEIRIIPVAKTPAPATNSNPVSISTSVSSSMIATHPATASSSSVESLVFGEGEGKQPAPVYPREARRAGQEGVVRVRFQVDTDGKVISANASGPCRWPLLNEAAVQVVRDRWHFRPGALRVYEVPMRFALER